MVNNQKTWFLLWKDGSLEDFRLICNVSVISTGFIWVYLRVKSSDKILDAYYTIMVVSLAHFGFILLLQLKRSLIRGSTRSLVRLVSNPRFRIDEKPILRFLKRENTGIFIFTCVMIDSRTNCCKIGLLVYYASLNLLETYGSKKRAVIRIANFGLCILENVVLVLFWYESFKALQFNRAICYTLMYLLRIEETGSTNKSLKWVVRVIQFCYKKLNRIEEVSTGPQSADIRSTSLGFDCYSIISDAK
ncbi:hypothetical protein CANMA_005047 [Candida margitis]|uniref:uncharacterized protein n=1 Tax=Candida margitis TaxID=1775924 RepID=UPI0022262ADF|nr:uncharacterized protein CANMA_005047 [Candida margitis]KAI5952946.1 hypothetical protein CANMA_005047 [Candida margitis]